MELIVKGRKGKKYTILYDESDHEIVNRYTWHIIGFEYPYAITWVRDIKVRYKAVRMHRLILGVYDNRIVDHRNRNTLDNRRSNIRICTHSENSKNKKGSGKSKFLGVHFLNKINKWVARIQTGVERKHLGVFESESDAAKAYDAAARIYHGEFANLNFKD